MRDVAWGSNSFHLKQALNYFPAEYCELDKKNGRWSSPSTTIKISTPVPSGGRSWTGTIHAKRHKTQTPRGLASWHWWVRVRNLHEMFCFFLMLWVTSAQCRIHLTSVTFHGTIFEWSFGKSYTHSYMNQYQHALNTVAWPVSHPLASLLVQLPYISEICMLHEWRSESLMWCGGSYRAVWHAVNFYDCSCHDGPFREEQDSL